MKKFIKYAKITINYLKENKVKVLAFVAAVFALAKTLGSTILTPAQREAIMTFLAAWL